MTTIVTTSINNGDVTDATIINSNFTSTKTAVNGNLDDENISAGAAIQISKLKDYPGDGTKALFGDGTWSAISGGGGGGGGTGYAVALPASPVDGQEYMLVDSVTLPTYTWRFRYNAGSSNTDKWEFIGGSDLYNRVNTAEGGAAASNVWTDTATPGPSVTVPRAGVYMIRWGMTGGGNPGASSSYAGVRINATDPPVDIAGDVIGWNYNATAGHSQEFTTSSVPASTVFKLRYKDADSSRRNSWSKRWICVTPVRVS